ncbi:MAG: histidinol-phosphatase HisJ family protein [Eubacterium sp.]|nr:histidinol-phosphatase HisJ family protein [Eubacterium sp.]
MFSDYHVHSGFSFDSDETLDNIITKAISLGMNQIAITEHQDFNWPVSGESPSIPVADYLSAIDSARKKYTRQIQILKGIELGLMKGTKSQCQNLIASNAFDFVIGSCHIVDNMDPYYSDFWKKRKDREAFELYFHTLLDGLKMFDSIDTLGHMDYIVRYSPNKCTNYSIADYMDVIDEILNFIINKNIKLEINTANLAKGFTFPNPHTDIIKRYRELGGEFITVGSDAHKAYDIGYGFDKIREIVDKYNLKVFTK